MIVFSCLLAPEGYIWFSHSVYKKITLVLLFSLLLCARILDGMVVFLSGVVVILSVVIILLGGAEKKKRPGRFWDHHVLSWREA